MVELIWSLISNKDFVPKSLSYIIVSAHMYSGFALSRYPPPPNEFVCFSIKIYSNQRISLTDPPQAKRRSKNSFQFRNIKSEQTLFCSMYLSNVCVITKPPFVHQFRLYIAKTQGKSHTPKDERAHPKAPHFLSWKIDYRIYYRKNRNGTYNNARPKSQAVNGFLL